MSALIELLYRYLLDHWHLTNGLLNRDEYREYQACCRFRNEAQAQLEARVDGEERNLLETWLKNQEQAHEIECRLCFARGLAMGVSLGSLAAGE